MQCAVPPLKIEVQSEDEAEAEVEPAVRLEFSGEEGAMRPAPEENGKESEVFVENLTVIR